MTQPEIPDALRETVDAIAAKLDDIHFNSRHGSWIDSAKEIVQAALLAEGNRAIEECAGIADAAAHLAIGSLAKVKATEIASAIRALLK